MSRGRKRHAGPFFPVVENYRGRPVGVWLGAAFVGAVTGSIVLSGVGERIIGGGRVASMHDALWMLGGCVFVFLVGLYDDFRPIRTRGLTAHFEALAHGRVTSGVIKLVGILGAAAVVTWMLGARGQVLLLGSAVVAGSANLWNLLDVRPGRALKFFLPVVGALSIAAPSGAYPAIGATAFGAGVVALAVDLRERGMLGDGGSNVLGFIVGLGLLFVLTPEGLVVALAGILTLHAASETLTLSRMISAVPALRWFDDLGRVRRSPAEGSTSS